MADEKVFDSFTGRTSGNKINAYDTEAHNDIEALQEENEELKGQIEELNETLMQSNAGAHNCIYRGKYLGDHVTDEQYSAISGGTFDDLYIGDYWTIDGFDWVIADFDYWYRRGDSGNAFNTHHALIVPSTALSVADTYMNPTNTTEGGYQGSYMYTEGLERAKEIVIGAFGESHVKSHREYFTNAITDGRPSGGSWVDSTVDLMNEEMVYGCPIRQQMPYGGTSISSTTIDTSQLSLFRYNRELIIARGNTVNGGTSGTRYDWWLRDIVSASAFAYVNYLGIATHNGASGSGGVRPAFCIS